MLFQSILWNTFAERMAALDAEVDADWATPLDRRLAQAADRQGYGSEEGRVRHRRLQINTTSQGQAPVDPAAR